MKENHPEIPAKKQEQPEPEKAPNIPGTQPSESNPRNPKEDKI